MGIELERLGEYIGRCADCALHSSRTLAVPGEGSASADLMLIGEGPGFQEDRQGRPFVGPAGQLLGELLASIGLRREDVYITNMVKCRPPGNRDPLPGEVQACAKHLERQIELISPAVIATLGRHATARFLPRDSMSKVRGRPRHVDGRVVFPSYHPAAALHQQSLRSTLEKDFRTLQELLRERPPAAGETPGSGQLSMF